MPPLTARRFGPALLTASVIGCCVLVAQNQKTQPKIDPAVLADAPVVPQMVVDSDGTLHFGPRTVPPPALESPEARRSYTRQMLQRAQTSAARGGLASVRIVEGHAAPAAAGGSKQAALQIYPVVEESSKIGGVGVTIYSPKTIPPKNRNRVLMEFEMDAEAIAVASLGQLKVVKVNYRGGGPSIPGNEDIVAVYRELLKTHKPGSIGMFGASGGCTLAQTTILWHGIPLRELRFRRRIHAARPVGLRQHVGKRHCFIPAGGGGERQHRLEHFERGPLLCLQFLCPGRSETHAQANAQPGAPLGPADAHRGKVGPHDRGMGLDL